MRMEAGLDTGPVMLRRETAIRARENSGELEERLARKGGPAISRRSIRSLRARGVEPQDETLATYAAKLTKSEARLDWREPAVHWSGGSAP